MDPLSILGIAGNIVQFVDAGLKVVSKGNRIYRSSDGSLAENNDLELVTNDLLVLQAKLQRSLPVSGSSTTGDENDKALRKLLGASNEVAEDLIKRLNAVKARGRFRRWNSFRQALKSVCSKAEVDEIAKRLSGFRDELQTRILVSLSFDIADGNREWQQALKAVQESCNAISGKVRELSDHILLNDGVAISNSHASLPNSAAIGTSVTPSYLYTVANSGQSLPTEDDIQVAILRSFQYDGMHSRQEAIDGAHAKTFRWILEEKNEADMLWDNFMLWLRSEDHLYWLKGKAASGKSTLVKFLVHQPKITDRLRQWAGPSSLVQAEFFFWALGTPIQKSQTGLLMSLLLQIFLQSGTLVRQVLPDLWNKLARMQRREVYSLLDSWRNWNLSELTHILDSAVRQADSKVCLFIDGLDEFSGNPADLAAFFSRLATHQNVKICLSGRPLPSLEYEFTGCPSLQLQDLTKNDIRTYVYDRLSAHRQFTEIYQESECGATEFVDRVVEMSSGVFLWVQLVTKSLLEGLTNFDTAQDLEQRLKDLPPELDALYRSMLQGIAPSFYKAQASKLLQIVHQSQELMSGLALSFIDEPDQDLAFSAAVSPISDEEAESRIDSIIQRLKSRTKGLIEVQEFGHGHSRPIMVDYPYRPTQVKFLHLTVKEFLEQPKISDEIAGWVTDTGFDVNMASLRGMILLIKKTVCFHGWGQYAARLMSNAMFYARRADNGSGSDYHRLVDEIDKTGNTIFPLLDLSHWSADFTGTHQQICQSQCSRPKSTFIHHAIQNGLLRYVKSVSVTDLRKLNSESANSLLIFACGLNKGAKLEDLYVPHPPMVKFLLDIGLDPNENTCGLTPWVELVSEAIDTLRSTPEHIHVFVDTLKLFILYGADLDATLPVEGDEPAPIVDKLIATLNCLPRHKTSDLLRMIEERRKVLAQAGEELQVSPDSRPLSERITKPNQKRKMVEAGSRKSGKRRK